jgi:hypothetical protein
VVDFALDADAAAVEPDEFLHESEAYAAALMRSALLPLDAVETLKQQRQFVRRNTDTVSLTVRRAVPSTSRNGDSDRPRKCKLESVGEKIEDDFLPHVTIDKDRCG